MNKKIVLSWSFWTWKSTLLKELEKLWYPVIQENSRRVLNELWVKNNELQGEKLVSFQKRLIEIQIQEERKDSFITDTSLIENLAYSTQLYCYNDLVLQVERELKNYDFIFFCPLLNSLEDDWVRYVDREYQEVIDRNIKELYQKYNYRIIELPIIWETYEEQLDNKLEFILKHIS